MQIDKILAELFVSWTKLKIRIHIQDIAKFPKEREIWWASLGQNVGVEINGKNEKFERPVLVVKTYNLDSMLVLPISSKIKEDDYCFKFLNNNGEENIINISQLKSVSVKRFIRKIYKMDNEKFAEIKEKLKSLL
jgi:mRNA interferase MazF